MITVLRLGHRKGRDPRLSTHVGLSARALGADSVVFAGEEDPGLIESVNNVAARWGGTFRAVYEPNPKAWLRAKKKAGAKAAHLTMYGTPVQTVQTKLRTAAKGELILIVGSEKVPREFYEMADWNLSVTGQPHSEVAALAVTLLLTQGEQALKKRFAGAQIRVHARARGKRVERAPRASG